jgi:hypothetical protein
MPRRWSKRPEGSNWGEFSGDDQLDCINRLTEEKNTARHCDVRHGQTLCLSLPLDYPGGRLIWR